MMDMISYRDPSNNDRIILYRIGERRIITIDYDEKDIRNYDPIEQVKMTGERMDGKDREDMIHYNIL